MALTDNSGTQIYLIPCGVPSDSGVDTIRNFDTNYYFVSSNDFILWGQSTHYPHVSANYGSEDYFLECSVPSDIGLVLSANNGTHFYYSSSFNCVRFCP